MDRRDSHVRPTENYALVSPDRDWQDRLQALLTTRQSSALQYSSAPSAAAAPYTLPSFRQLSSPQPQQPQQQTQSHPLMQSTMPVTYSTKLETGSPVGSAAMLSPLHASYGSHSPQPYHGAPHSANSGRLSWDGFNGYSRIGGDGSDDAEPKARYELAPADNGAAYANQQTTTTSMPRMSTDSASSVPVPRPGAYDADPRFLSYSDPQRWYYTNQQAVG